jgi:hypothetical protein
MLHRTLLFCLLVASSLAAEQAQYGKPNLPQPGSQTGSQARSQTTCPWLTPGSAAKMLGGDVSMKVSLSDTGKSSCRFLQEGSRDSLEILVSKAALASCPPGSKALTGIGNQAARCKAPGSHSGGADMVSGRVRDLYFTVTHTSRVMKRPVKLSEGQEDPLEQIAEQIAGNLY